MTNRWPHVCSVLILFALLAAGLMAIDLRAAAAATTAQSPPPRFDIDEYRVIGNTVLPPVDVEAAVYDYLGPQRTQDDVNKAQDALAKLYSDRGYPTVTVEVPEQTVGSGVITLKVTERRVGRLRVTGSRYVSLDAVKAGAPSLAEGTVLHTPDVTRDVLSLNQLPARTVTPVLKAGKAPDTVDVDLQVADQFPAHASLEYNNRRSADTTSTRVNGSIGYDNLWQRGDSASFFFQVAPENTKDAQVYSGSYLFHIPGSRLSLLGSYLKSDSNVSVIGGTNVVGKGQVAGLRLLIPVAGDAGSVQTLAVGMDWKSYPQNITVVSQTSQSLSASSAQTVNSYPIEYYPVTIAYTGDWFSDTQSTDVTTSAVFNFRGLGSSEYAFDQNRYAAKPSFFYVRGGLTHQHDLPFGLQAWGKIEGQFTPDVLVPNEQISVGGLDTVRGYLESEALGDNGGSLQMELRAPELAPRFGPQVNELRAHAFADFAKVTINQPLPQQRSSYSLGSVGTGVHVRLFDHYNGALEDAITLSPGASTKAGVNRVLFRLYGDF